MKMEYEAPQLTAEGCYKHDRQSIHCPEVIILFNPALEISHCNYSVDTEVTAI